MSAGIQRVVTSGTFELDGGSWDVDNNIWLVGDDNEVIVIDAAHNAGHRDAVASPPHRRGDLRTVTTTTSPSHRSSKDLDAPVFPESRRRHALANNPRRQAVPAIEDGQVFTADGVELHAISTPGHSPGSTLPVCAGPGRGVLRRHAVPGWPRRRRTLVLRLPTILGSIRDKLGKLPPDTVVYTGHGDTTRIGDDRQLRRMGGSRPLTMRCEERAAKEVAEPG